MSKLNKKHSVFTFQDEWFGDEKYSKWIGKALSPTIDCCLVCKKNSDIR